MSFLSSIQGTVLQGYAALQGPQAQPQSATETLNKLVDRLTNSSQHEDRRSSLLGIKSMARDWKSDVGRIALPAILDLACEPELADDVDMTKAVLETLNMLCESGQEESGKGDKSSCGTAHVDTFLMKPEPTHAVLCLLSLSNFYIRFFSLQLLGAILTGLPPQTATLQAYFLTAPGGLGTILSLLDDTREIIRNETLLLLLNITSTNADIQKIIAFEGGFDRLFHIIDVEGGLGAGGIVVQDCLLCVGQLLKYNVSNQNYFRETSCIPHLAPMLLFPPMQDPHPVALDSFATQPWSDSKLYNALLVLALARTLVSGAGTGKVANQKALLSGGFTRCLAEIGLASAAPPILKSEALHILANVIPGSQANQEFINKLVLSPLAIAYPTSDQDPSYSDQEPKLEFHRLPPQSAILALFSLALEGNPGTQDSYTEHNFDELCVRSAALSVIESLLAGNLDAQLGLVATMNTPIPQVPDQHEFRAHSPGSLLFAVLQSLPSAEPGSMSTYTSFFASLIFAHLLRGSEKSKQLAREIRTSVDASDSNEAPNDNDESTSLVHILVGNLMMAQRMQSQSNNAGDDMKKSLGWSRVMVGYLIVLATWLWKSPLTTSEFLMEGTNLQVLIDPISQSSGVDPLVQGLCAFVLGIIYETDHDPASTIPRSTLYPILHSRVGPDQFVNRILRLREDDRFKNVGPDALEMNRHLMARSDPSLGSVEEPDLWFDWPFVEFFKNNYRKSILFSNKTDYLELSQSYICTKKAHSSLQIHANWRKKIVSVQQSILIEPGSGDLDVPSTENPQQNEIIVHLKKQLADQSKDLNALERKVEELSGKLQDQSQNVIELEKLRKTNEDLNQEVQNLTSKVTKLASTQTENEKEQEDLLVLLEEVTGKRRRDKALMREKGLQVSDDEDEGN